jgi:hypothetical protein
MVVIRDEQMRVFERAAEREFENRMVARIHGYFPKHGKMLDAAELRALVTLALERARGYGLTTERNVALSLDIEKWETAISSSVRTIHDNCCARLSLFNSLHEHGHFQAE